VLEGGRGKWSITGAPSDENQSSVVEKETFFFTRRGAGVATGSSSGVGSDFPSWEGAVGDGSADERADDESRAVREKTESTEERMLDDREEERRRAALTTVGSAVMMANSMDD